MSSLGSIRTRKSPTPKKKVCNFVGGVRASLRAVLLCYLAGWLLLTLPRRDQGRSPSPRSTAMGAGFMLVLQRRCCLYRTQNSQWHG